ncbi:MAG: cation:proton antiporter, partial [Deltaproteobacteria bacterium]|nr:cation:proton antiporter [Deltaproteobacteria bacterium]
MSLDEAGSFPVERFLLAFAIILVTSKVFGEIAERVKQPAVLGELIAGILIGGSVLAVIPSAPGEPGFAIFQLLAEVGVAILLFEIGLETDLNDLLRLGITSSVVAVVGVVVPFALGFISVLAFEKAGLLGEVNPMFTTVIAITAGATLTATSVGITARVLSDMNRLQTEEARIILGAAVIDDVIGLIILSIVSGLIATTKQGLDAGISITQVLIVTVKSFGFLFVAILIGNLASSKLFNLIERMQVRGVLLLSALSFAFIFAVLAGLVGLAPIVGAFAAGLVLAKTNQFKTIESRLKPVSDV